MDPRNHSNEPKTLLSLRPNRVEKNLPEFIWIPDANIPELKKKEGYLFSEDLFVNEKQIDFLINYYKHHPRCDPFDFKPSRSPGYEFGLYKPKLAQGECEEIYLSLLLFGHVDFLCYHSVLKTYDSAKELFDSVISLMKAYWKENELPMPILKQIYNRDKTYHNFEMFTESHGFDIMAMSNSTVGIPNPWIKISKEKKRELMEPIDAIQNKLYEVFIPSSSSSSKE